MILDRMFTLAGALDIIGLLLCVFILAVIVLKAADLRQAVPIVAYFTVLGLGFGAPDEVGPLFQALTASISYLLILQVAIGRLPAARHLAVLALPLFGLPMALAAVGATGVCGFGDACPEFATFLRVFVVVPGSMVLLLPLVHPGLLERLGSRLRPKWYEGDRYWVVLTLIVFNLFNMGVDLLRTEGVLVPSEAMATRTIFGLALVYLVTTLMFRIEPAPVVLLPGLPPILRRSIKLTPEEQTVADRISDLMTLDKLYLEPTLSLASLARKLNVSERVVARVISGAFAKNFHQLVNAYRVEEAKHLNQSDLILTLMSVFWDEGRAELEKFCRDAQTPGAGQPSPFNHFIRPSPDQLLRVSIGLGLRRARLATVYSILRGKDLETRGLRREQQFAILKQAQARVINLQYWHDFFKSLILAGYRSETMIGSQNALLFSYVLYLFGRTEYGVDEPMLRRRIAQWFFMAALTGRYASSPETTMEFDLARLRPVTSGEEFVTVLRHVCETTLTHDFWKITLPDKLATDPARSPSMFAYVAALDLLDARILFSEHTVAELMDPAIQGPRTSLERHPLFSKSYLESMGIAEDHDIDQIANFTVVEWGDNTHIADKPPAEYMRERGDRFVDQMSYWHALPPGWETMEYREFLRRRGELMAQVMADAYEKLAGDGARPIGRERVDPPGPVEVAAELPRGAIKIPA